MRSRLRVGFTFLFVLFFFILFCASSQVFAVEAIRNGDFSSGMDQWNVNPIIDPAWNPQTDPPGGVKLSTGNSHFTGVIVYQNLNVTAIAGKKITLAMDLSTPYTPPPGKTVAVYLSYVQAGVIKRVKVLNPDNSGIGTGTFVSTTYAMPSTATRIVKLEIAKEDYGDFTAGSISLTGNKPVVGAVPVIASVSPDSGVYGDTITIAGSGFGTARGTVLIDGSTQGITILTWSPAQITATVSASASGGRVEVATGFLGSNNDKWFDLTSPHFSVRVVNDNPRVVKGQDVSITVRIDFRNGFTSTGVKFDVLNAFGAVATIGARFKPVPVKSSGGVDLKITTGTKKAGTYNQYVIRATDTTTGGLLPRTVPFAFRVVTVKSLKFFQSDPVSHQKTYPTNLTLASQGRFYLDVEPIGSDDAVVEATSTPMAVSSSGPEVLALTGSSGPEFYANKPTTTSVTLTAQAPDGTQATLPVTVKLPPGSSQITEFSLWPQTITNMHSGPLFFDTRASDSLASPPHAAIGADYSGMQNFGLDWNCVWVYQSVSALLFLTSTPTELGRVMFHAESAGGAQWYEPLTVVNDPAYGQLQGRMELLDDGYGEDFDLEFYQANQKKFTRSISTRTSRGASGWSLGGIPPGYYKLKAVPTDGVKPQWYPNADTYAKGGLLNIQAGKTTSDIFFFLAKGNSVPPGAISINSGAQYTNLKKVSLKLTAKELLEADQVCLSQTGGSCSSWYPFAPTIPFTLSAGDGTKIVFATFKDKAGNVSAPVSDTIVLDTTPPTDGTLTAAVTNPGEDPNTISLNWSGFSDTGSGLQSYKVVSSDKSMPPNCDGSAIFSGLHFTEFSHRGLMHDTTYYYRACGVDNAGNMSPGATAEAHTYTPQA